LRDTDIWQGQEYLPIGASKKCCWTCHRLGEKLFDMQHHGLVLGTRLQPTRKALSMFNGESSTLILFKSAESPFSIRIDIKLQLPGTHGIVFGWDPPSFGVPSAIWEDLARELREMVVQVAFEQTGGKEVPSRQFDEVLPFDPFGD
jgi:hypothetical protein